MGKTAKMGDFADPRQRVRFNKNGRLSFIKVGKGNPDAIKPQQGKLASCAKQNKGLPIGEFRKKMGTCLRK
jgi:hypothetical protein